MYCWSCGHKNPDTSKFCGDCGKAQVRPPVLIEEDTIADNVKAMNPKTANPKTVDPPPLGERPRVAEKPPAPVAPVVTPVIPPEGTGITPGPQRFVSTNPLIGESRFVKETPLTPTAVTVDRPKPKPISASMATPELPRETTRAATRISGPSFLGLSDEPESSSEPSEYLLDDEQESASTARSYIALGLILLLGVLLYKQWDSVSATGRDLMQRASAATSSTTVPTRQPEIAARPTKASVYHGVDDDAKAQNDNASSEEGTAPGKATGDAALKDAPDDAAKSAPANGAEAAKATKTSPAPDPEPAEVTEKDARGGSSRESPAAAPKNNSPQPSSPKPSSREAAAAVPVYDDSQIDLAQKYLQGRGVAQDCHRGVSLLRAAAAQSNPKAQIKLGALYATGHCVTQDRAEAYRWFAEAQQVQPGNQWIDKNLNSLWAEMTPQERGRAQR